MGGYINMVFILLENPVSANSEIQTGKKHENNGKVVLSVDMKSTCICQTKETDILWIYILRKKGVCLEKVQHWAAILELDPRRYGWIT